MRYSAHSSGADRALRKLRHIGPIDRSSSEELSRSGDGADSEVGVRHRPKNLHVALCRDLVQKFRRR
jgi:hypothetical protein